MQKVLLRVCGEPLGEFMEDRLRAASNSCITGNTCNILALVGVSYQLRGI